MADVKNVLLSNMPVMVAGLVAIVAAGAWIAFLMSPDEDPARAPKSAEAKVTKGEGLPPMRALPAPGTDLLPPLSAPPAEPSKVEEAAAPAAKAPAPVKPAPKA